MGWKRSRTAMAVAAAAAAAAIAVTVAFVSGGPGHASTHASREHAGHGPGRREARVRLVPGAARAARMAAGRAARPAARCCPSRRR